MTNGPRAGDGASSVGRRPTFDDLARDLARALFPDGDLAGTHRRRAEELLRAAGVPALFESLEMAERILRAGEGFHSIERFFVDGSDEQRFLVDLLHRDLHAAEHGLDA